MRGRPISAYYYSVPGIITQYQGLLLSTRHYPDFSASYICKLSVSHDVNPAQHYELSVMAETKKMVQVLLDFKANWRDHSYFRDLTRVIKDD